MGSRLTVIAALGALALAGCGSSSSDSSSGTGPAHDPGTNTAPRPAPPPHGRLTAEEYTTLIALEKKGDKLGKAKPPARFMRRFRALCADVKKGPDTDLMHAEDRVCRRVARFFGAFFAFETEEKGCRQATSAGDPSCFGELFSRLARASNSVRGGEDEVNKVLRARKLRGRCADGIGRATPKDFDEIEAIGHSARLASQAIYAHTSPDQIRATVQATGAALERLGSDDSDKKALAELRTCKH